MVKSLPIGTPELPVPKLIRQVAVSYLEMDINYKLKYGS
jgi:hypothetical protein